MPDQTPTTISMSTTKHLLNTLPSYISLYTTSSQTTPPPLPSSTRNTILKWYSTLSPPTRLSHLTILSPSFLNILLQMLSLSSRSSHVTFLLLPDLPSSRDPSLPSLCHRTSYGLLSRMASTLSLREFVTLFSSDGERLDTVSFKGELVEDVGRFVEVMDGVSGGRFLNGEEREWEEVGREWGEMGWLREKGYYSLEEFVVNRIEIALRSAWLSCCGGGGRRGGGRRGGVKKVRSESGVGANVFWRKRGCVEWWEKLGKEMRRKVFKTVFAKASKAMTLEILRGTDGILGESLSQTTSLKADHRSRYRHFGSSTEELQRIDAEFGLCMNQGSSLKPPSALVCALNRLAVLQVIASLALASQNDELDSESLFFSSLASVNTISDRILRKVRGLLMIVSLDSTKLELLEEDNQKVAPKKSKEKVSATNHKKKKGKSCSAKKVKQAPENCDANSASNKKLKDSEPTHLCNKNSDLGQSINLDDTNGCSSLPSSPQEGENVQNSAPAKNRRKNRKKKSRGTCNDSSEVQNTSSGISIASSSCVVELGGEQPAKAGPSAPVDREATNECSVGCQNIDQNLIPCVCKSVSGGDDLHSAQVGNIVSSVEGRPRLVKCPPLLHRQKDGVVASKANASNCGKDAHRPVGVTRGEFQSAHRNEDNCVDTVLSQGGSLNDKHVIVPVEGQDNETRYNINHQNVVTVGYPSYEWPAFIPHRLESLTSQHLPRATDRLHLEVGHNWQSHFQSSLIQPVHRANPSVEVGSGRIIPQPLSMSYDWPPIVRACDYDSAYISQCLAARQRNFAARSTHFTAVSKDEERKCSTDCADFYEPASAHDVADDYDGHWVSEEEYEVHTVAGVDYNQYFGGGIMYWNPSDYRGAGFSHPPSLSSDDSSWAWREADMNRTVDDMVAFSSSYSTNGLTSPSGAPFCSPFESLPPGHQAIGYVRSGSEVTGKVLHTSSTMTDLEVEENGPGSLASALSDSDAKSGDSLPYPILRPIIIPNMSRDRSRSEFKGKYDVRSPRLLPSRREHTRIKRPPSPVVLCVPRAPHPPPPSPVGDTRKHRGFPTVRSGSSSPRHWGVRGWFHDGGMSEEAGVRVDSAEVVWPSWGSKKFSARQMVQPLPATLLQDRLIAISQLTHDKEHPDVALPLQPPELLNCPIRKASLSVMHNLLHEEIDLFCKQVAAENLIRRPYINWAVKRVTRSLQVLWPRSRTNIFGSNATGLSLPTSDVDLVVCLPPVRNLEPIKEAGILEGRNSIKETCLQHAARYLGNQEWVKADSLKTVENTAIPIIMLVADVPHDFVTAAAPHLHMPLGEQNQLHTSRGIEKSDSVGSDNSSSPSSETTFSGKDAISVRLDISFKSPSHTGLQTTELVKQLTDQFPAAIPLALVLKQFLADRCLDQAYSGGLSSYCLVLLITRFLQHEHHHGRPINQNLGSLFMDFLYFFGNVFDPRQMRISIQGSGLYINRERGYSIDPIYIDDPLFPTNNVGKNCFRIHQCIKAFADAYSTLENELTCLATDGDVDTATQDRLLPKIIPSISI